jgi:predicted metalloprotease with PDZ domain
MALQNSNGTTMALLLGSFLVTGAAMLIAIHAPTIAPHRHDEGLPGLTVALAAPPSTGLIVTSLQSQGPAERAGVQVGDDVLAIDHHAITSLGQARDVLRHDRQAIVQVSLVHNHLLNEVSLMRIEGRANGA